MAEGRDLPYESAVSLSDFFRGKTTDFDRGIECSSVVFAKIRLGSKPFRTQVSQSVNLNVVRHFQSPRTDLRGCGCKSELGPVL